MKPIVREHFGAELRQARIAIEAEDFESAWVEMLT